VPKRHIQFVRENMKRGFRLKAELTADKEKSQRAHIRAIEQQTDEMRRQREQRERELDPALRAFREQRFQAMNSGGVIDEESFDLLAARSAWGRWQAAQHHFYQESAEPPQMLLQLTAPHALASSHPCQLRSRDSDVDKLNGLPGSVTRYFGPGHSACRSLPTT
jgi:hypothetical protein